MTNCKKRRCLHGKTESVDGVIWKKCSKDICWGLYIGMGVDSAIISFNFGANRLLGVLKEYGFVYRHKASRERLRTVRKGFGDKEKGREGVVYAPGICDLCCV